MNRNYPYEWAYNDQGSSGERNPCNSDYRGPYAGSEPEVQAMMQLASKFEDSLKVIINYHAFGNMMIIPFNFDT